MKYILLLIALTASAFGQQLKTPGVNGENIVNPAFRNAVFNGSDIDATELGYLNGVTSAIQTQLTGKEPVLGNPGTNGYVLSSTTGGTRSWITPGGTLTNASVNAVLDDAPLVSQRAMGLASYNSTLQPTSRLWRMVHKANKTRNGPLRFRAVTLGDSVAASVTEHLNASFGYGGLTVPIVAWASEGGGVSDAYDQWSRTLKGTVRTLNSATAGGTYCEYSVSSTLTLPVSSVNVHYLAATGNGRFRLDYKVNGTGAWIAATTATVSSSGGSVAAGVVYSDNGGTETYSEARFALPKADYYYLRLVAVSDGPVKLCYTFLNAGGFSTGPTSGQGEMGGAASMDFAEGGRSLAGHFTNWNQGVLNRAMSFTDPHIIIYKSANSYNLSDYQTHWPSTAEKLRTAAPDALLVVCGSHPQAAEPTNLAAGSLATDDYLRDWCANTEGAVFVDVRQNFPAYQTGFDGASGLIDDLWADGVHIYGVGSQWVSALVWDAIKPGVEAILRSTTNTEYSRVLPYQIAEIRLSGEAKASPAYNNLSIVRQPRSAGKVVMRPPSAFFNSGTQSYYEEAGFSQSSEADANSPNTLMLISKSRPVMQFAEHSTLQSGYLGAILGTTTPQLARAKSGFRVLAPTQTYGALPGMTVEGLSTMASGTEIFKIAQGATEAVAGTDIYTWHHGGDRRVPKTIAVPTTELGARTIDKVAGRVNFAAAATSLAVTNNLVTANSIITVTKATNNATARLGAAVAAAGSFVIYMDVAPDAECAVNFKVEN